MTLEFFIYKFFVRIIYHFYIIFFCWLIFILYETEEKKLAEINKMEDDISVQDKMRIVSDFILHAPPGEFNEVFNDVRELLKNDTLLKEGASSAFAKYNKDQLTPVRLENAELPLVVSEFNDLGAYHFK